MRYLRVVSIKDPPNTMAVVSTKREKQRDLMGIVLFL